MILLGSGPRAELLRALEENDSSIEPSVVALKPPLKAGRSIHRRDLTPPSSGSSTSAQESCGPGARLYVDNRATSDDARVAQGSRAAGRASRPGAACSGAEGEEQPDGTTGRAGDDGGAAALLRAGSPWPARPSPRLVTGSPPRRSRRRPGGKLLGEGPGRPAVRPAVVRVVAVGRRGCRLHLVGIAALGVEVAPPGQRTERRTGGKYDLQVEEPQTGQPPGTLKGGLVTIGRPSQRRSPSGSWRTH
jgi:hypothetical protein